MVAEGKKETILQGGFERQFTSKKLLSTVLTKPYEPALDFRISEHRTDLFLRVNYP